jgi:LacI family transcriptional regulator
MRPTIRDVAQRLGLSITTVSRALDGYSDVAEDTRRLVVKTADEMGYVPNRAARQLRRQRTDTIGYIIPSDKPQFADPFFSDFIAGLGDEAATCNYDLLVSAAQPASSEEKALYQRWVYSRKVDGMVVNRVFGDDWRLTYLGEQMIPHTSLERSLTRLDFVGVEVDSQDGFRDLIEALVEKGHKRIAYIGGNPDLMIDHDRYSGYRAGLMAVKIKPRSSLIERADLTPEGGFLAAQRLLSLVDPPTAIVCINDLMAIGAMHAASARGLKVGKNIAIAGFDGISGSAYAQPPLTTLEQPVYTIARQLAKMLIALIEKKPLDEKQVKIHPRLVLRASTGN